MTEDILNLTTWRCLCLSIVPEATLEARSRALKGRRVSSISPSKVWYREEEVMGRNKKNRNSSSWGSMHWFSLPTQFTDFLKKVIENDLLVAQPVGGGGGGDGERQLRTWLQLRPRGWTWGGGCGPGTPSQRWPSSSCNGGSGTISWSEKWRDVYFYLCSYHNPAQRMSHPLL